MKKIKQLAIEYLLTRAHLEELSYCERAKVVEMFLSKYLGLTAA